MATNAEVQALYTDHGLRLIRLANGMSASASKELQALSKDLRRVLRTYDPSDSPADLKKLLKAIANKVATSYTIIGGEQFKTLDELIDVETRFALRSVGAGDKTISAAARRRLSSGMMVHGAPVTEHWARQSQDLSWKVINAVRAAHAANVPREELMSVILGQGQAGGVMLGGMVEVAIRNARSLADSSVQSVTRAARVESFKAAPGVGAMSWFGLLDAKICPNCALRVGKLYTLDFKPIGHDIPMGAPPPLHPFCRCMLTPMKFPNGVVPKDGGKGVDRFENWLEKRTPEQQADLLGEGRVALWQSGKLTLSQLIGQDGRVMTLRQLKGLVDGG